MSFDFAKKKSKYKVPGMEKKPTAYGKAYGLVHKIRGIVHPSKVGLGKKRIHSWTMALLMYCKRNKVEFSEIERLINLWDAYRDEPFRPSIRSVPELISKMDKVWDFIDRASAKRPYYPKDKSIRQAMQYGLSHQSAVEMLCCYNALGDTLEQSADNDALRQPARIVAQQLSLSVLLNHMSNHIDSWKRGFVNFFINNGCGEEFFMLCEANEYLKKQFRAF